MISAETPVLFSKACELFVMELSVRAWMHTQLNNRKTLQRNDVAFAIRDHSLLAFLNDIVPLESHLRVYIFFISPPIIFIIFYINSSHI